MSLLSPMEYIRFVVEFSKLFGSVIISFPSNKFDFVNSDLLVSYTWDGRLFQMLRLQK
jgi:hypothetical protein